MKAIGIREFKAHLSQYLREVQRSEIFLVTDRGRVVAELRPPSPEAKTHVSSRTHYQRLVDQGVVRAPAATRSTPLSWPFAKLNTGTVSELIDADREE